MIKYLLPILLVGCGSDSSSDTSTEPVTFTIGGSEYSVFYDRYTIACDDGSSLEQPAEAGEVLVSVDDGELTITGTETGYIYSGRIRSDNSFVATRDVNENNVSSSVTWTGTFIPGGWSGDLTLLVGDGTTSCEGSTAFTGERLD